DHRWIGGMKQHIPEWIALRSVRYRGPGGATIRGAQQAGRGCGHQDRGRFRVDRQAMAELDLLNLPDQTRGLPGLAVIDALEHADRWRAARVAFTVAGEDVDGARVERIDRDIRDPKHR